MSRVVARHIFIFGILGLWSQAGCGDSGNKYANDHKVARVGWSKKTLQRFNREESNHVYDIISSDESWIYAYDPDSKQQYTILVYQDEPKPKKMVAAFVEETGHVATIAPRDRRTVNAECYTLFRLFPVDEVQLEAIGLFVYPNSTIEVLKKSRGLNDSTDVLVPPDRLPCVESIVKERQFNYEIKRNYGRSFESVEREPRRRVLRAFNVFEYHSYNSILDFIDTMRSKHPELIEIQPLGLSYEGRKMKLVKISHNHEAGNPIIFIDAGIHAREWVAPAMALYLIQRLVMDPEARRRELNAVDWYILPVVNPDGYEFTRTSASNRMWRKTRSEEPHTNCLGVDGNRNYGFYWAVSGVSRNPCNQETYAGTKPFSEPETRMVRDVMLSNADRIKLYVSLHAYGQYLVYPWGYTGKFLPRGWEKLDKLARDVSDAVQRAGGDPFQVMSAGQWYPAAGGSDDFAFGAAHVPYAYTMELTDKHEFIYPEKLLPKALPQFYEGFRVFGDQIRHEFSNRRRARGHDDQIEE